MEINPSNAYFSIGRHAGQEMRRLLGLNDYVDFEDMRALLLGAVSESKPSGKTAETHFVWFVPFTAVGKQIALLCALSKGAPAADTEYVVRIYRAMPVEDAHELIERKANLARICSEQYQYTGPLLDQVLAENAIRFPVVTVNGVDYDMDTMDHDSLLDLKAQIDYDLALVDARHQAAIHDWKAIGLNAPLSKLAPLKIERKIKGQISQAVQRRLGRSPKTPSEKALTITQEFVNIAERILDEQLFNEILNEARGTATIENNTE